MREHSDRAVKSVLVLGGSGFIGRHAVLALSASACRVVIGSRRPARISKRLPSGIRACECRLVRFENMLVASDWHAVLDGIDIVINCVGILRPRGRETYDRVHQLAPAALAAACNERGCRLIHVSALGLDAPVRSGFLRSKREGEQALLTSGADWYIVRPSLLDGDGGFGAKWLRRVARWPVHPMPADAVGRIAAFDVRDLGEALARLATRPESGPSNPTEREFDLGGLERHTLAGYLAALRRTDTPHRARRIPVPGWAARLLSHVCDVLHLTPFSFGHWELLRRDNYPQRNRLPELLGRAPRAIGCGASSAVLPPVRPGYSELLHP